MNILFVHQNFPGQFKHLAPAMARRGHRVTALHMRKDLELTNWRGVTLVRYRSPRESTPNVHPWVTDFEAKVIRAEACFRAARRLRDEGFAPEVIVAHHGWGESLFLNQVWPEAKLGIYCEFYYSTEDADIGFDPEFPIQDPSTEACRLRMKNLNNEIHFDLAQAGISPTRWQANSFPEPFRSRISVIHDGINTTAVAPNPEISMTLNRNNGEKIPLRKNDEIITFVNRNLEPYRGYHVFMRSLPELLRRRPRTRILIVGGNGVSYGPRPDSAKYGVRTWKDIFADEVRPQIGDGDWERVHFLNKVPYSQFISLLQLSMVHVYLTYPFVLSWSLLEAMSAGCAVVASDTRPLEEAILHNQTGRLVKFNDVTGLVEEVCQLLDDPDARARLGANAREYAQMHFDLNTICLPRQVEWIESLAKS